MPEKSNISNDEPDEPDEHQDDNQGLSEKDGSEFHFFSQTHIDELQQQAQQEELNAPQRELNFSKTSQGAKRAVIFGSVNQSDFYAACKKEGIEVPAKFQQSGFNGFLPFSDPGVCKFMSNDFARAVTEGRYNTWKEKISATDREFVARLRSGQYDAMETAIQKRHQVGGENRDYGYYDPGIKEQSDTRKNMEQFELSSLASELASKMKVGDEVNSCLEAPCVTLNVRLKRTGLIGNKSAVFGHEIMFTMAVDEQGRLDKQHLLVMDPNAGIIKINNDKTSIDAFLQVLDTKLFSQMQLRGATITGVTNTNLPEKGTDAWQKLDQEISTNNAPDSKANYALPKLYQLDEYLRTQISRLESKSNWSKFKGLFTSDSSEKLAYLQKQRTDLNTEIEQLKKPIDPEGTEASDLFHRVLKNIDSKILGKQRGFLGAVRDKLGLGQSQSMAELQQLKDKFSTIKDTVTTLKEGTHNTKEQADPPRFGPVPDGLQAAHDDDTEKTTASEKNCTL